jgi:hypothetical protein
MRKRVICDENLPHKLRTLIPEHDVFSVAYMQWVGIKNGELLDVAERAHFDVLITSDQGIPHQQNMAERRLAVVLLPTPDWNVVQHQSRRILAAIELSVPGTFTRVEFGAAGLPG